MKNSIYFKDISIEAFRGLSGLRLDDCARINLILGNNNIGKTSVLEGISLFRSDEPFNLIRIVTEREKTLNSVDGLTYLYPIGKRKFAVYAKTNADEIRIESDYEIKKTVFNRDIFLSDLKDSVYKELYKSLISAGQFDGKESNQIEGQLIYNDKTTKFSYVDFDLLTSVEGAGKNLYKIRYISPSRHFDPSTLSLDEVLGSDAYKKVFIKVLQLFGDDIEDILYLDDKGFGRRKTLFVKRKGMNAEPVSIYGDGMKKAIVLASCVAAARNGVLLIDEIETSLYHGWFEDIFAFLIKACCHFNVQLFTTTHSKEVIETFISIGAQSEDDSLLSVYTLRKDGRTTKAARVSGKKEFETINKLGLEIRE